MTLSIADAGLEIGLGTDAGNPFEPHGPGVLYERGLYVEAGLTPAQALQAATLSSARILGVAERSGSIEAGKIADLVLVRGDPRVSIAAMWNIKSVLKAGVVCDRAASAARNAALEKPALTRVVGTELPAELSNFDDEKLAAAWDDPVAKGNSTAELSAASDGETHLLRMTGKGSDGFQDGAWAGATLALDARGKLLADASKFKGLRLRVRGTPRPCLLTLQCAAVKDYNVFSTGLEVKAV